MLKLSINGVQTIFSAQNYKGVSCYTTIAAKTLRIPNSMVEYLVNSLGFSKDEAFTTSKVSSFKSTVNPNFIIDFLQISGLSQPQLKNLVSRAPKILSCNVDNALKPKIQALQELGFSGSESADILTLRPDVCWSSLDNHIVPAFEMLKSVFGNDNEIIVVAVKRSTWLLSPSAKGQLPGVISLLQSYGLPSCQIKIFSLQHPGYEPILIRVEKLGIPRGSWMFFHGICALCSLTESNLEMRMGIYKSCGFTDEDILTLFRRNPYSLLI